jgi:hypothetical protein
MPPSCRLRAVPIAGVVELDTVHELLLLPHGLTGRQDAASQWLLGGSVDDSAGVVSRSATLYAEAAALLSANGLKGVAALPPIVDIAAGGGGDDSSCVFELREYQLQLGYDTVPKFLELYGTGLPSKLGAEGTCETTSLVTGECRRHAVVFVGVYLVPDFWVGWAAVMYCEVGSLNHVMELWRHGGGATSMERSRVAARSASQWRQAIAQIAELALTFGTTVLRPCPPPLTQGL